MISYMVANFQFSLRNLLWAAFWLSVSGASYSFVHSFSHDNRFRTGEWPMSFGAIALPFIFLVFWSPFVAVGILIGRVQRAMVVGAIASPLIYLIILWATLPDFSS